MKPLQIEPAKARGRLKENLWEDNNGWIAEFKFDGCRYLMHLGTKRNLFTSRRESVKGSGYVEKSDTIPHLRDLVFPELSGTVLDGELVHTLYGNSYDVTKVTGSSPERAVAIQKESGFLKYFVFDVLYYKGVDIRDKSLALRLKIRDKVVSQLSLSARLAIHKVVSISNNKKRFYHDVLRLGGEGLILKDLSAPYGKRTAWVKAKKSKTWDVIITGFLAPSETSEKVSGEVSVTRYAERGWIGSICIAQYKKGKLVDYGSVSGIDEVTRAKISYNPNKYIGKVIEIEAQERLSSGKFRHPRFIRFREDKRKEDCVYDPNER